ncbi:hypothetical protein T484DRAFT_3592504 [Baffinella frigidus]|nr:hypothetical protein T484DRAFT_3592504 [Cryptophyta sp. CCMP2293]
MGNTRREVLPPLQIPRPAVAPAIPELALTEIRQTRSGCRGSPTGFPTECLFVRKSSRPRQDGRAAPTVGSSTVFARAVQRRARGDGRSVGRARARAGPARGRGGPGGRLDEAGPARRLHARGAPQGAVRAGGARGGEGARGRRGRARERGGAPPNPPRARAGAPPPQAHRIRRPRGAAARRRLCVARARLPAARARRGARAHAPPPLRRVPPPERGQEAIRALRAQPPRCNLLAAQPPRCPLRQPLPAGG